MQREARLRRPGVVLRAASMGLVALALGCEERPVSSTAAEGGAGGAPSTPERYEYADCDEVVMERVRATVIEVAPCFTGHVEVVGGRWVARWWGPAPSEPIDAALERWPVPECMRPMRVISVGGHYVDEHQEFESAMAACEPMCVMGGESFTFDEWSFWFDETGALERVVNLAQPDADAQSMDCFLEQLGSERFECVWDGMTLGRSCGPEVP